MTVCLMVYDGCLSDDGWWWLIIVDDSLIGSCYGQYWLIIVWWWSVIIRSLVNWGWSTFDSCSLMVDDGCIMLRRVSSWWIMVSSKQRRWINSEEWPGLIEVLVILKVSNVSQSYPIPMCVFICAGMTHESCVESPNDMTRCGVPIISLYKSRTNLNIF